MVVCVYVRELEKRASMKSATKEGSHYCSRGDGEGLICLGDLVYHTTSTLLHYISFGNIHTGQEDRDRTQSVCVEYGVSTRTIVIDITVQMEDHIDIPPGKYLEDAYLPIAHSPLFCILPHPNIGPLMPSRLLILDTALVVPHAQS